MSSELAIDPEPRRAGRPRSAAARDAALKAAAALLAEGGLAKLTMDGIAARAGIGKRTIYRWWPTKGAVAVEAFLADLSPRVEFNNTASAAADIRNQLLTVGVVYRGTAGRTVREMVALGQTDAAMLATFLANYIEPRRRLVEAVLKRGIANGEFRPTLDFSVVVDSLYGPLFFRLLVTGAPLDDAFVGGHADIILRGLAP